MQVSEETKIKAVSTGLLLLANFAVVLILGAVAWFTAWSGLSFAVGFLAGMCIFFTYARLKLGYWI